MTDLALLYVIGDIDADLLEESMELFDAPTVVPAPEKPRRFARFMNSGWGAAVICAFVGLGVMAGLLWAGRHTYEPPYPPTGVSEPISEDTVATDPVVVETVPPTETPTEPATEPATEPVTEPVNEGVLYEPITQDGLIFTSNGDGTCSIKAAARNLAGEVVVPEASPYGDRVSTIASYGFSNCASVTSVTLPDSVTAIGSGAFQGCNGLLSIRMPKTLTSMGTAVFQKCTKLESIVMPDGLATLPTQTFETCTELKYVEFGEGLVKIGDYAFNGCSNLSILHIPGTLTSVGNSAFFNCCGLSNIYFGGSREQWKAVNVHRIGNSQFSGTNVTLVD